MSYFIYADIISSLLDLRLVVSGSILIHVDAYGPKPFINYTNFRIYLNYTN